LEEWVEEEETELDREWIGRKSRGIALRITCMIRMSSVRRVDDNKGLG
jgi:hypothetical protein